MSSGNRGGGPGGLRGDRVASGVALAVALALMGAGMLRDSSYEGGGSDGWLAMAGSIAALTGR